MKGQSKLALLFVNLLLIALISFYLMPACHEERKPKRFCDNINRGIVDKRHNDITISNVTITVKTTKRYHETRVRLLLKTWIKKALNQVRTGSVWLNLKTGTTVRVNEYVTIKADD